MPKAKLSSYQFVIECENEIPTKDSLRELFFDEDFTSNEEYFRDDTLKLGYSSEAERIIDEVLRDKELSTIQKITTCIDSQISSSDYYVDSNTNTYIIDNMGKLERIVVSVSYMTYS
jgi:hypothetical protein